MLFVVTISAQVASWLNIVQCLIHN